MSDSPAGPEEAVAQPSAEPEGNAPVASLAYLPEIPDFLGKASRIEKVATLIQSAQEQLQHFKSIMVLNRQDPTDRIVIVDDKGNVVTSDTPPPTYQDRFDSLQRGMQDLLKANEDIKEDLALDAVKRRKEVEQRIEKAHREALQ